MLKLANYFAGAFVAVSISILQPVVGQTVNWDMSNEYNKSNAKYDSIFAEFLKTASAGKIVITNHYGGALGYKSKDHWSAVEEGGVVVASTYTGVFAGIDPVFSLVSMPFLARNVDESKKLVDAARPAYEKAFAKGRQKLLLTVPFPPVGIWAKRRVSTMEELKGLKIRTYDKTSTITLRNAGASAIQLSWADIVPALSTGTIHAVLTADEAGLNSKFYEHMKFFNAINFVAGTSMFHMNLKAYEALSPALQKTVIKAAKQTEDQAWSEIKQRVDDARANLGKEGVTVVWENQMSAAFTVSLQNAAKPVIDGWRDSMPKGEADKILVDYRAMLQ